MKRDKPPLIQVVMTPKGLKPLTADDAEKLVSVSLGHTFDLTPNTRRSNKQLRTYWKALGLVVRATGKWPSPEHLHDELKWACGYRRKFVDWETKQVREQPDSIALNEMTHEDFCQYMDVAMSKLADAVGFDPLHFLEQAA